MARGAANISTPSVAASHKRLRLSPEADNSRAASHEVLSAHGDSWTSEEEIALFKALIRYKPTGLHKHFHMLSIATFLRSSGHYPSFNAAYDASPIRRPHPTHTRIPGIWRKLGQLYDLDALDEREFSHADELIMDEQAEQDAGSNSAEAPAVVFVKEFALPVGHSELREPNEDAAMDSASESGQSFPTMMWNRRIASETASSPPEMTFGPSRLGTPSVRGGRRGRGRGAGRGRRSTRGAVDVQEDSELDKASVTKTTTHSSSVEETLVPGEDDEDDEDEGEATSEVVESGDEADTASPPAKRGRGGGRGKGSTRGSRGRRGGRGRKQGG